MSEQQRGPTVEDMERQRDREDEAYDRWAEAQPEKTLFDLDPMKAWPFPAEEQSK